MKLETNKEYVVYLPIPNRIIIKVFMLVLDEYDFIVGHENICYMDEHHTMTYRTKELYQFKDEIFLGEL